MVYPVQSKLSGIRAFIGNVKIQHQIVPVAASLPGKPNQRPDCRRSLVPLFHRPLPTTTNY
jgi:hypothetical protein